MVKVAARYPTLAIIGGIGGSFVLIWLSTLIDKSKIGNVIASFGKFSLIALCIHLIDLNVLTLGGLFFENYGLIGLMSYRVIIVVVGVTGFVKLRKLVKGCI